VESYISRFDSDIFSLQEVNLPMVKSFVATLQNCNPQDQYDFIWEARNRYGDDGCGTIYKTNVLQHQGSLHYKYTSGQHILLASSFVFKKTNFQFWNINTHLNWKTRNEDSIEFINKVNSIQSDLKLAMGDFNAEASETWYKELAKYNIIDSVKAFQGQHPKFSYNSGKGSKFIDYLLLWNIQKDALKACFLGIEGEPPNYESIGFLPNGEIPSDHLPITIHLDIEQVTKSSLIENEFTHNNSKFH